MPKSEYSGYVGYSQKAKAKSASEGFEHDYEGMKTSYDTYKKSGDPSSKDMQNSLRVGNEKAAETLHRTERDSDNELRREARRGKNAGELGKPWDETFKK